MEPVEINNGQWYLRGLRCDDRVDDRPALTDLGEDDLDYVHDAADGWADGTRYTWAVCEPTTGEMLAEIALDPVSGYMSSRARPGFEDVAAISEDTVLRMASMSCVEDLFAAWSHISKKGIALLRFTSKYD